MFLLPASFGSAYEPTARERQVMADIKWWFIRTNRLVKTVAYALGYRNANQLSAELEWRDGRQPKLCVLTNCTDAEEREWIHIRAPRVGLRVIDDDIGQLID